MDLKYKDVIVVYVGEIFVLEVDIRGKFIFDIVWLKDGKEFEEIVVRMEIKFII